MRSGGLRRLLGFGGRGAIPRCIYWEILRSDLVDGSGGWIVGTNMHCLWDDCGRTAQPYLRQDIRIITNLASSVGFHMV